MVQSKHCHSKKGRMEDQQRKMRLKQDQNPAEQTSSPEAPYVTPGAHEKSIWIQGSSVLPDLLVARMAFLLGWPHSMPATFFSGLLVLAFPLSWGFHCNLDFNFPASSSSPPGLLVGTATLPMAWPQQLCGTMVQDSTTLPSCIVHTSKTSTMWNTDKFSSSWWSLSSMDHSYRSICELPLGKHLSRQLLCRSGNLFFQMHIGF